MKSLQEDAATGSGRLATASGLRVEMVEAKDQDRFDQILAERHYLGECPRVGDFVRQVVVREGQWVALLVWGPAALKLKEREKWIGWNPAMAAERLKLIVQNRRYLLLHNRGQEPNLASQALAAACRVLSDQWQERFGYRPLIAESFTDPEAYEGTCRFNIVFRMADSYSNPLTVLLRRSTFAICKSERNPSGTVLEKLIDPSKNHRAF